MLLMRGEIESGASATFDIPTDFNTLMYLLDQLLPQEYQISQLYFRNVEKSADFALERKA